MLLHFLLKLEHTLSRPQVSDEISRLKLRLYLESAMLAQPRNQAVVHVEGRALVMGELGLQRRRRYRERVLKLAPVLVQVVSLSDQLVAVAAVVGKLSCNLLVVLRELLCDAHGLILDELARLGEDDRLQVAQLLLKV